MFTKIAFVAQPTRDLARARQFYSEVLGLTVTGDYGDKWCEVDTPDGKSIALDAMSPQFSDNPTPYLALESDDLEAELARLEEGGATITQEMWVNRDGEGAEICRMALIADPDGNTIMLHQIAPHRK